MLKEGDKAPLFSLESDAGKRVSLSDFAGKKLVLYFYPKDDTPGCTREAQAFAAAQAQFVKAGAAVVGVSRDSVASHCKFRDKYKLNFPLLSDPDRKVHEAYGAWGEKVMYGKKVEGAIRSTFVIEGGKVVKAFPTVKVDGHAEAVLAVLGGAAPAAKAAKAPGPAKKKTEKAPAKAAAPAKKKAAKGPAKKKAAAKPPAKKKATAKKK